jgi:hypothetical protein
MLKRLTIELTEERAVQVAHVGKWLGLTAEQVLALALNVCLSEWREIIPGLEAYEGPLIKEPASSVVH